VAKGRTQGQPDDVAAFAASDLEAMRWLSLYDYVVRESDSALLLAPVGSRLWLRIAASAALGYGVSHAREKSAALAQQLIEAAPAEADTAMFCVAAARLAIQLFINDSIDSAVRLLTRLETSAAPLLALSPYVRGWVDETRGFALARIDDGPAAVAAWARAERAFADAGDARNERAQRSNQSYVQASMCATKEVERLTKSLIAEARAENITGVLGGALINLGWVQFVDGHPDHLATLREAAAVCDQLVDGRHPPMAHGILSAALLEAGDLAGAEREALKALEVAIRTHYVVDVRVVLARVLLKQGRYQEALEQLGQPLHSLMAQPLLFRELGHFVVRAQTCEALRDVEGHRAALWDAIELLKNVERPLPEAIRTHWRTRLPLSWLVQMAAAAKIPL
jgi:tetratricopeptide (TPR) repeat protein